LGDDQFNAIRRCILFVDDEQAIRRVGERALTQAGFEVLVADSGGQALELYARHQETIELVILDLSMPQMNGIDTFRELLKVSPDVRVVLSSGYDASDAEHHGPELKPAGFIQKPYRIASLLETVVALLRP
jgi:DNA-binding response OmpR family regulator